LPRFAGVRLDPDGLLGDGARDRGVLGDPDVPSIANALPDAGVRPDNGHEATAGPGRVYELAPPSTCQIAP
jgi:hypothetical protein